MKQKKELNEKLSRNCDLLCHATKVDLDLFFRKLNENTFDVIDQEKVQNAKPRDDISSELARRLNEDFHQNKNEYIDEIR